MKLISIGKKLHNIFYLSARTISVCAYTENCKNVEPKKNIIWFSFNTKNFDDLKSNISDEILTKECITKPPFGYRTSLGNFLNIFCMFYQNSRLFNEKNFHEAFYKYYTSSNKTPNRLSFDAFKINQKQKMNEILLGENTCSEILVVDMKNNRTLIRLNDIINKNLSEINTKEVSNNTIAEIKTSIVAFINKFHEMYLQGLLGNEYLNSIQEFSSEYMNKRGDPATGLLSDPLYELFQLCFKVDCLLRKFYGCSDIDKEGEIRGDSLLLINESFEILAYSVLGHRENPELHQYPEVLMKKALARTMYFYEENRDFLSFHSKEFEESVDILKNLLKEHFKDMDLSEESVKRLVILCFELNV